MAEALDFYGMERLADDSRYQIYVSSSGPHALGKE